MGISNVMQTGRSGMQAAHAGIGTAGHNITNANTEGYNRQKVQFSASSPTNANGSKAQVGAGVAVSRIERLNDEYLEKQVRNTSRDLAGFEEKEMVLKQAEDVFNEMNGDGLNRLVTRFFNEFRKLSNEPDNEAVRQSVREAANALVNDFKRIRGSVDEVRKHIDARIEGHVVEANALSDEVRELNIKIKEVQLGGGDPNALLDQRDLALKRLGSYFELQMHKDNEGQFIVDVPNVGPLVTSGESQRLSVSRSPRDEQGKHDNALDILCSTRANAVITHQLKGGKLGALVEARDQTLSVMLDRMDELAFGLSNAVNSIHRQGFTRTGAQGVNFFKELPSQGRAAEFLQLSDEIKDNVNNIAAAAQLDAPGDNRVAVAISGLQHLKFLSEGRTTIDDFYNSIVSEVAVANNRNSASLRQQKDVVNQMSKMREQLSGVSIDEETANLMQFHQAFGASAKVIQVADEMLETVLNLKR